MKERIGHTNEISEAIRLNEIEKSSRKVGRAVFFSILVTLISFAPILFLTGQERKLFTPLILTKTFTMIGSAIVALTIVPVLMRTLMKGRLVPESRNPVSNFFIRIYSPILNWCLNWKKTVVFISLLIVAGSVPFILRIGSEFMPPLDEGSLLFMPVTLPDVSNTEAKRILQLQDKLLRTIPEVENVLGKAGRANTATDNAPISMVESIIVLKPQSQWRPGITKDSLITELNALVRIPGVANGWTQPIINRINMLSTGIRTDVGVKVYGQNLDSIYSISRAIENELTGIDGLRDLYVEQLVSGKYLNIELNRSELARYGLNAEDVNMLIESAIGGMNVTTIIDGRRRYALNVRLGQDFRSDTAAISRIPLQTNEYGVIPLSAVAEVAMVDGPAMINSENALLRGTVLFNVRGRDMGSVVRDAKNKLDELVKTLPEGYYLEWSGQYENQVRAEDRLKIIIPIVLVIICFILYFTFNSVREPVIVLCSLPVALIGGVYSMYLYNVNFSVAVAVGFIALFGIAIETGVLMMVYLNEALGRKLSAAKRDNTEITNENIRSAVFEGSVLRVRPKLMTVMADMLGLLPVLISAGTGSDVMKPIAIPFVFGLITSTLFVLIVLPVIYMLVKEKELSKGKLAVADVKEEE